MRFILSFSFTFWMIISLNAQLTVEKIMQDPAKWIGTSPSNIFWSEDSKIIYFMWNPDQNPADSLYQYDTAGKVITKVSLEDRRQLPDRYSVTYTDDRLQWLFTRDGDIFIKNAMTGVEKRLTNTTDYKSNATFSPDGKQVIFKQGKNLYTIDIESGLISQITNFVEGKKKKDVNLNAADKALQKDQLELFMTLQEEKSKKDATEKYRETTEKKKINEITIGKKLIFSQSISPNMKYVFYKLRPEDNENKGTIIPNYVTASGYTEDIPSRSKVGLPDNIAESYIYNFAKDTSIRVNTDSIPGINDRPAYLSGYKQDTSIVKIKPRPAEVYGPIWSPNGNYTIVVARSQDHKDRWILQLNPEDGSLSMIDRQRDEAWIGGPGIGSWSGTGTIGFIDENTLYYQSEATGYAHLYTYNFIDNTKNQLTSGKFEVQEVKLSNDRRWFYLKTNEVHPGETHFYKMSVKGGKRIQITQMSGGNEVTLSPDESSLAIRYSNTNTPWELYLQENDERKMAVNITKSTTKEFNAYAWKTPEVISFKAIDSHDVYARVYQPKKTNGKAVIFVHGAGYLQNAHKWWSQYFREYMFHNLLVDKGYTVMDIDYRASSGYGRDTRTGIYRHMGGKDLDDNIDGAKLLISKYGINPKKIGIYGGSYGGFITLMAMFTTPDVFAVGAALRPVTDWAAYNQGYTSNILNEPQNDSIAYRRSSPIFFADGLKGKLLICHGQVDVNVHIQDSYRLTQRLIELRKENWEMASYPVEDHGFVQPTSWMDEYKRILKLFESM